jgi:repressor of nif and glnA expression
MTDTEKRRRTSILGTLSFDGLSSVFQLRSQLESVHGIVASADLIRADLAWLEEMGLVQRNGDAARCTERGADVANRRASFPGD